MKTLILLLIASSALCLSAQSSDQSFKHLPAAMTPQERAARNIQTLPISAQQPARVSAFSTNFTIPGEWEESQAVLVEWPYIALQYDTSAVPATNDEKGNGVLWAQLVDAIQEECPAWIVIWKGADSVVLKQYMKDQGRPLVNYRFFIPPLGGNGVWTRDFGPIGCYYGDRDSIGFVDLQYYDSRARDDSIPSYFAGQFGYPSLPVSLHAEGGNFMTDGYGHGYFSSYIAKDQEDYKWSRQKTMDSIQYAFHLSQMTELPSLVCDGGTGHIDMYLKLIDEETFIATRYPSVVTAPDRETIDKNIDLCKSLVSVTGYPYKLYEFPMATDDDGHYYTTCDKINLDARGYINGVFVNKTFIVPIYSNAFTGNASMDLEAMKLYGKLLPGYKIVPIDSRVLSPDGGAVHCITMQIPAENPIRFLHATLTGSQPLQPKYMITARITNRDGIKTAQCKWRKKGESEWNAEPLMLGEANPAGFGGGITNMGFERGDIIEYYIEAESNNGKTMTKPITAPDGYYSFTIDKESDVEEAGAPVSSHLLGAYPNPAQSECILPFMLERSGQATIRITDITGREESVLTASLNAGFNSFRLVTTAFAQGVHFYSLHVNGKFIQTSRFTVVK